MSEIYASYIPTAKNVHNIIQIIHTPFRWTNHTDDTDSTQVDDPDPADRWHPPMNTCRSYRSYRPYLAVDVQICRSNKSHPGQTLLIVQITQILLRYTSMKIVTRQIPFRLNVWNVIAINQITPGTQVDMIRNIDVSPGKLVGVCR